MLSSRWRGLWRSAPTVLVDTHLLPRGDRQPRPARAGAASRAVTEAVSAALDPVQAALTTEELTALNKQVDVDKMDPNEVAAAWLKSKGLA